MIRARMRRISLYARLQEYQPVVNCWVIHIHLLSSKAVSWARMERPQSISSISRELGVGKEPLGMESVGVREVFFAMIERPLVNRNIGLCLNVRLKRIYKPKIHYLRSPESTLQEPARRPLERLAEGR